MNGVSPGCVTTPTLADFWKTLGKCVEDDLKLNRSATAEEIAPMVTFTCNVDARWMNRANVAVDADAGAGAWQEILG